MLCSLLIIPQVSVVMVLLYQYAREGFDALLSAPGSYCGYACLYLTLCLIKIFTIATQTFEEQSKYAGLLNSSLLTSLGIFMGSIRSRLLSFNLASPVAMLSYQYRRPTILYCCQLLEAIVCLAVSGYRMLRSFTKNNVVTQADTWSIGIESEEIPAERENLIVHEGGRNSRPTSMNLSHSFTGSPVNISNISATNSTSNFNAGAMSYEVRRQSLAEMASQIK